MCVRGHILLQSLPAFVKWFLDIVKFKMFAKQEGKSADIAHCMQAEAAALKADLLALRQQHLRSRALSVAGSDFLSSDEDAEEEGEQLLEHSSFYRPSRQSRYAMWAYSTHVQGLKITCFNTLASFHFSARPEASLALTKYAL